MVMYRCGVAGWEAQLLVQKYLMMVHAPERTDAHGAGIEREERYNTCSGVYQAGPDANETTDD